MTDTSILSMLTGTSIDASPLKGPAQSTDAVAATSESPFGKLLSKLQQDVPSLQGMDANTLNDWLKAFTDGTASPEGMTKLTELFNTLPEDVQGSLKELFASLTQGQPLTEEAQALFAKLPAPLQSQLIASTQEGQLHGRVKALLAQVSSPQEQIKNRLNAFREQLMEGKEGKEGKQPTPQAPADIKQQISQAEWKPVQVGKPAAPDDMLGLKAKPEGMPLENRLSQLLEGKAPESLTKAAAALQEKAGATPTQSNFALPAGLEANKLGQAIQQAQETAQMPRLPATVGTPAWSQQVGQQLVQFIQKGEQNIDLKLHPRELGNLHISIKMVENTAQIQVNSPHALVRAAFEQAVPQLREAMAESGLSLGETQVGDQSLFKQQQGSDESGQRGSFAFGQPSGESAGDETGLSRLISQPENGLSGINLYV